MDSDPKHGFSFNHYVPVIRFVTCGDDKFVTSVLCQFSDPAKIKLIPNDPNEQERVEGHNSFL